MHQQHRQQQVDIPQTGASVPELPQAHVCACDSSFFGSGGFIKKGCQKVFLINLCHQKITSLILVRIDPERIYKSPCSY